MKVLVTGGSGLLGRELRKLRLHEYPTRAEFDICSTESMFNYLKNRSWVDKPELVVNCAAYTAVEKAEIDKEGCYRTNVLGVRNLVKFLQIPVLQISTAYVFDGTKGNYKENDPVNPLGYYALTKALAEEAVLAGDGKIIRTLFKPKPWPFPRAYDDQITSGGYVDDIAKKIDWCIKNFDFLPPILHVGMKRQSILDLALETRSVFRMSRTEVAANLPEDVSLDDSLYRELTGEIE